VIIPVLNEESVLEKTLRKIVATGVDEVIGVDGGSFDTTPEIVRHLGCRLIRSPRGRALQMNAGAKVAQGDVLLFLHADTLVPLSLKKIIQKALSDPGVVGGRFDLFLDHSGKLYRLIARFANLRSRLTKISTGDQAIFVRRAVFDQLGGFSDIPLMEDVEFSSRLKQVGRIACLHDRVTTSARRWEKQGPLKTVFLMWKLRFLYFMGVSPDRLKRDYLDAR
jgi:rSAM/selenodomain-associated transferase 2